MREEIGEKRRKMIIDPFDFGRGFRLDLEMVLIHKSDRKDALPNQGRGCSIHIVYREIEGIL